MERIWDFVIKLLESVQRRRKLIVALSAVVVFVTTYMLILPAFTLEKDKAAEQGGFDVTETEQTETASEQDEQADEPESAEPEAPAAESEKADTPATENADGSAGESADDVTADKEESPAGLEYKSDDYTVAVTGDAVSSGDLSVEVREIDKSDRTQKKEYDSLYRDALTAVQEKKDGKLVSDFAFAKFYDITLKDGEGSIEPSDPVGVTISYEKELQKELRVTDPDKVRIIHFAENKDTGKITPAVLDSKNVDVAVKNNKMTETAFEADSFSVYAVVYTVDFTYSVDGEEYEFTIDKEKPVKLSELLKALNVVKDDPDTEFDEIAAFMGQIKSVELSSPELLSIDRIEGGDDGAAPDWLISSLKAFSSEEELTIGMENGDSFVIRVTDAQEIHDSTSSTIDVNKSYLICYESGGMYYLLKNDGSVDSSHTPADFENLNSTYCWTFNFVFEEKDREGTLTYNYYLIRPIDNKKMTIALNAEGQPLLQQSNNNVAVVPTDDGFRLLGYNNVKLDFVNGGFAAKASDGVIVHIYEMDTLPVYDYTVRSSDESRGTVSVAGGTTHTDTDGTHYVAASSNSDKKNAGTITATPVNHKNNSLRPWDTGYNQNKWLFDHWEQDGIALDRDQYPQTINTNSLPIPFNGSRLVAHFKQNPAYVVPDNEKEPSSFSDMTNWLSELTEKHYPLDEEATAKTAEVFDYENRIYRVDITSKANFDTFDGNLDMAFCMDVSNSMYFPSKLVEHRELQIYQINDSLWTKRWLDQSRDWNNPYYLVADESGTATVFKIYYQGGNWKAQDASRTTESDKSFIIGEEFETNWTKNVNPDKKHPFGAGDDDNSYYMIYNAGDNGRNRFYYLNQSFAGATSDLTVIKDTLAVAGAQSPQVRIAYNTFNKNLGTQRSDFVIVNPLSGINLDYASGGGTRPDQAFNDAVNFNWRGNDRYVVLITDGAPQGVRTSPGDEPKETTQEEIYDKVRTAAQQLKTQKGVKFITIGLSMDKVTSGKRLLYDLADTDQDGNKMFYMAESASDLPNILRQIIKTVMEEAVVYADVTDEVNDAFYPVDKLTGKPLSPGEMIDIEGRKTTDSAQAAGILQADGKTIKWINQPIDQRNGWHGTIYVKAKEDLIGANAVKTNGSAEVKATKYKIGGTEYTFDSSLVQDKLQSLIVRMQSPRVNVNELTFSNANTDWTVYLGTDVDPKTQLKAMYEEITVDKVLRPNGDLNYGLLPNDITDKRETETTSSTADKFRLAPVILELIKADNTLRAKYISGGSLNWDAFLTDILGDGVSVPYHPYGIEGEDSRIVIKLDKAIQSGEEEDLVGHSPHAAAVANDEDEVENYTLTVKFYPDYDHVLPPGQGGSSSENFRTGSYGTMYQGHSAGNETSTNTHIINVIKRILTLQKTDSDGNIINDPAAGEAEFEIYKKDQHGNIIEDSVRTVTTSGGAYTWDYVQPEEDQEVPGEYWADETTYYIRETSAPAGYAKYDGEVTVTLGISDAASAVQDYSHQPYSKPYIWTQAAEFLAAGDPAYVSVSGDTDITLAVKNDKSADIDIIKTDTDGNAIPGAKFSLAKGSQLQTDITVIRKGGSPDDPQDVIALENGVFTIPEGGVTILGLGKGTYTLTEVEPPAGYNKTVKPVVFTVAANGTVTYNNPEDNPAPRVTADHDNKEFIIQNEPGAALPHTGGIGTIIFYVIGSILVLGAGIFFIARRRAG